MTIGQPLGRLSVHRLKFFHRSFRYFVAWMHASLRNRYRTSAHKLHGRKRICPRFAKPGSASVP